MDRADVVEDAEPDCNLVSDHAVVNEPSLAVICRPPIVDVELVAGNDRSLGVMEQSLQVYTFSIHSIPLNRFTQEIIEGTNRLLISFPVRTGSKIVNALSVEKFIDFLCPDTFS